jgi:hypothetical protein
MNLNEMILQKQKLRGIWYERLISHPLSQDERSTIENYFQKHNPTFGQAFMLSEIDRKYLA